MDLRTLWPGRRRAVLNEALHELRRPLQALALAAPAVGGATAGGDRVGSSVQMARAALERLEREINGPRPAAATEREPLAARRLAVEAVERWRGPASRAGASLQLSWRAARAQVAGERCALAQALDNLIVNAIEHGGSRIDLRATLGVGWLRLTVVDSGPGPGRRRRPPADLAARLAGRRRRGHGLRVVRRIAAAHGGSFSLRRIGTGTEAVLELPLLGGEA